MLFTIRLKFSDSHFALADWVDSTWPKAKRSQYETQKLINGKLGKSQLGKQDFF